MALNDVSLDLKDSSGKESKDCWKMEKWMRAGQREKRKDEWVETAESLGFCLNNQILLFMWSKLLRSATGHVEKLNDCKERQRQANGLLRGSVEALQGKLRGRLCMLFAWWRSWHHDLQRLFFCLWFCASQSYRKMMRIHYWFILFYFLQMKAPTVCVGYREWDIWADRGLMCSERTPMEICSYLIKHPILTKTSTDLFRNQCSLLK